MKLVGENSRLWESIESHPMARDFIGRLGCDERCSSVGSSFTGNSYFLPLQETDFHLLRDSIVHLPVPSIWTGSTPQWMDSSLNQNKLSVKFYNFLLNSYLVIEYLSCSHFSYDPSFSASLVYIIAQNGFQLSWCFGLGKAVFRLEAHHCTGPVVDLCI